MNEELIAQQLSLFYKQGDYGRALSLANKLHQINPENIFALQTLSQIKLLQGLLADALGFAQTAEKLNPNDKDTLMVMARVFGARGDTERAVDYCDRALEQEPAFDLALRIKAQFLERAGRAGEALEILSSVEDQRSVAVLQGRCLLNTGDMDGAIEAAAIATKDSSPVRLRYHALMIQAKAFDRAGRYEEAFSALKAGNSLVRPKRFNISTLEDMVDKLILTYSIENMSKFSKAEPSARRHVIIAGMPRSGTTLVEQILDAHCDITGVGEAKELDVHTRQLQRTLNTPTPYPDCVKLLSQDQLTTMGIDYENALVGYGFDDMTVAVNKNLHNLIHLGLISMVLPNVKVIFTQRDPRDITISCLMGTFNPEMHPYLFDPQDVLTACEQMTRLMNHWESVLDICMTKICYEDLVANQEVESQRLVEFCDVPWDDRCLRFWETDRTVMTLAYDQVTKPMYSSSVNRWENYKEQLSS